MQRDESINTVKLGGKYRLSIQRLWHPQLGPGTLRLIVTEDHNQIIVVYTQRVIEMTNLLRKLVHARLKAEQPKQEVDTPEWEQLSLLVQSTFSRNTGGEH